MTPSCFASCLGQVAVSADVVVSAGVVVAAAVVVPASVVVPAAVVVPVAFRLFIAPKRKVSWDLWMASCFSGSKGTLGRKLGVRRCSLRIWLVC